MYVNSMLVFARLRSIKKEISLGEAAIAKKVLKSSELKRRAAYSTRILGKQQYPTAVLNAAMLCTCALVVMVTVLHCSILLSILSGYFRHFTFYFSPETTANGSKL